MDHVIGRPAGDGWVLGFLAAGALVVDLEALGQELDIEIGTERCPRCERPVTSERLD